MQRFGHFVNFFFTPLTLHCDHLRAPFAGRRTIAKQAAPCKDQLLNQAKKSIIAASRGAGRLDCPF